MDIAGISTLITNLGFPIACVIAMFFMWNKEREEHKLEMQEISRAITNNTIALNRLVDQLNAE